MRRSSINNLRRYGFRIRHDGLWVQFLDKKGVVRFQVSRDNLFDGNGNYFWESA